MKNKKIVYPYYNFKNLKKIKNFKINNKNDLIYVDKKNNIIYKKYKFNLLHDFLNFLYENFFIYSLLSDQLNKNKLRSLGNIHEIKKIEKESKINIKNYPYHWEVTKNLLRDWKKILNKKKTKFHIIRNIISYQYDKNLTNHDLSFKIKKLPEINYLNDISKKNGIYYHEHKRINKGFYYIHPRYGMFNPKGIEYFSEIIKQKILKTILR